MRCTNPSVETSDNVTVMARIAAHDRQAFARLYHDYAPALHAYLTQQVNTPAVAEAMLHEVMLTVWHTAAQFDPQAKLSVWLFSLAYRTVLRARANPVWHATNMPKCPPSSCQEVGPTRLLGQQAAYRTQTQPLPPLSPAQHATVALTFCYGFSYEDIATIMDCPVSTVKTHMLHARRCLEPLLRSAQHERNTADSPTAADSTPS